MKKFIRTALAFEENERFTLKDFCGCCLFMATLLSINWLLGFIDYVIK
jgi:hypothetical protein